FENKVRWMTRNWIFDRFLESVIDLNASDLDLSKTLQIAIYHTGLHLDLIRAEKGDLAVRILRAIEKAAKRIVDGDNSLLMSMEAQGRKMYFDEITSLLTIIEKQVKGGETQSSN